MIKQLVKPLLTGKGPNFSDLTPRQCGIGDYQLRYKLPGNVLRVTKNKEPCIPRVNLSTDLFDPYSEQSYNREFVHVGFEWWAYKGLFFQGDSGQLGRLTMNIDVNRAATHTPIIEGDLDSLEAYLKKDYWDYYETEENKDGKAGANWQARYEFDNPDEMIEKGYIPPSRLVLVNLPEVYVRELLNGEKWLSYSIGGEGIPGTGVTLFWAYPLNENYYLTVSFRMSSEIGDEDLRYQRMSEDAQRIMSMVEMTKC
ncbi:hypothetical protein BTA51_24790 [Hahella sp. CCB-MM4]|uniref:hypothetical protein n=1 Tax=Hahella sp. (strain CCB-MM4) TaxID=1926491 RepID=UPI000B9C2A2E|nr:hypothetical protein [Hahella sp. CCB-MM4]OZG70587.1 hypothetical protein BTA51_24790 [Hahella sp. CCB-MM4]